LKLALDLLTALRDHIARVDLDGQAKNWSPDQRQLVFPNKAGRVTHYGAWLEHVWQPLLSKSGLPYRKYHATRWSRT
jgi:hypothetical protein